VKGHTSDTVAGLHNVTGEYQQVVNGVIPSAKGTHTGNATLVVMNPGASDDVLAVQYNLYMDPPEPTPGVTPILRVQKTELTCTHFADFGPAPTVHSSLDALKRDSSSSYVADTATRNIASIPLRGSVRIRNITESIAVGGLFRVLRYNGGIHLNLDAPSQGLTHEAQDSSGNDDPTDPSTFHFLELCNMIRDSSRTHTFSGHEMCSQHQSNSYPADFVRSMSFEGNKNIYSAIANPGYCTLLFLIDDYHSSTSQINNTYEFNIMVQRAARFSPGSILHGLSEPLRLGNHDPNEETKAAAALVTTPGYKPVTRAVA
jgi:hypothetical protein